MAKGQKNSNREVRKPKANKPPAPVATASLFTKGLDAPAPKKKA
jgi:hypothetical protein